QRPLGAGALTPGHPPGPLLGRAGHVDRDRPQPLVAGDPRREARLDDHVPAPGTVGQARVELDVDLGVLGGVAAELGERHPPLGGHGPKHFAARDELDAEPGGEVFGCGRGARPGRAGDRDEQRRAERWAAQLENVSSSALRCCSPRPLMRRESAMPISSIARRAPTLPTPGSDSRTETTFIFPIVSLPSAWPKLTLSVRDPILSFSFSSAGARRGSAAWASAASRCSGVNCGGCGLGVTLARGPGRLAQYRLRAARTPGPRPAGEPPRRARRRASRGARRRAG